MPGQEPTPRPLPEEMITLARSIATRHVRTDRFASLIWAVIFGIGFLAFLGIRLGGSVKGHDALLVAIAIGLFIILPLYGAILERPTGDPNLGVAGRAASTTTTVLLNPQRRSSTDRRVNLHDGTSFIGTARTDARDP